MCKKGSYKNIETLFMRNLPSVANCAHTMKRLIIIS